MIKPHAAGMDYLKADRVYRCMFAFQIKFSVNN